MNQMVQECTASLFNMLSEEGLGDKTTVVLVGSSARGVMNDRSDVDILVLKDDCRRIQIKQPGDIHLQQDTRSRFLKRLEQGDDYPGWALRYGVPVSDPDGWWAVQTAAEQENPHWPDWSPKVEHAHKRMRITEVLLEVGDYEAASEELMLAASHVARATLLRRGVFPLSRPELPSQLMEFEPSLAALLERLIKGDVDAGSLPLGYASLERKVERLKETANSRKRTLPKDCPEKRLVESM